MRVAPAITALLTVFAVGAKMEAQTRLKLTLPEARVLAIEHHPLVKAASFKASAAEQGPDQVLAKRFPDLAIDFTAVEASKFSRIGAGDLTDSSALSRAAAGVSLSQLLFDFGRNGDQVQSSRLRAKSARQSASAVRAEIILDVDRAYFAVLLAQALERVAIETLDSQRAVLEQTRALEKHGKKSALDVNLAEHTLAESEISLLKSRNEIDAAFAALSAAIGSGEQRVFELAEPPLPTELAPPCSEMTDTALRDRPDLKALQFERDASNQFLRAEKGLRKPVITALWSAGYSQFRTLQPTPRYNAGGINIRVPVFNGRSFAAREAEASYKAREADAILKDEENRVVRDVRVACLNSNTAYQRIGLATKLVDRATETVTLAHERYKLGLSSIDDWNQALENLTTAEVEKANARFEYLLQRSVLEFQSGQLH